MTIYCERNQDYWEHNSKTKQSHNYTPDTSKCTRCSGPLQDKAYLTRCGHCYCILCLGIWGDNLEKCEDCDRKDVPVRMKDIQKLLATVPACLCFECFYDV